MIAPKFEIGQKVRPTGGSVTTIKSVCVRASNEGWMYTTADWQTYFESDLHPATLPKPTRKDIRIALADYINRGGDTEYTKFWSLIERLLETP